MTEKTDFPHSAVVELTYEELAELRSGLNVRIGNTSFGAVNTSLDVKLFNAQQHLSAISSDGIHV